MHFLKLILRNALRHKLRTGLTVVGFVVAFLSFGLLQTIVDAVRPGDLVLVKGSRGIRTDIVADRIAAEFA